MPDNTVSLPLLALVHMLNEKENKRLIKLETIQDG